MFPAVSQGEGSSLGLLRSGVMLDSPLIGNVGEAPIHRTGPIKGEASRLALAFRAGRGRRIDRSKTKSV